MNKSKRLERRANCQFKQIRVAKGLSVFDISEDLGVSDSAVASWEGGKRVPDALLMDDLCKLLKCTLEDLYPTK